MLGVVAKYEIDVKKFQIGQYYMINAKRYSCTQNDAFRLIFTGADDYYMLEITVQDILDGKYEVYTMDGEKVIGYEDGFDV